MPEKPAHSIEAVPQFGGPAHGEQTIPRHPAKINGHRQDPVAALSEKAKILSDRRPVARPKIALPPVLIEECTKLIYEFWDRFSADRDGYPPLPWERLQPEYQAMWRDIVTLAMEMGVTIILKDAIQFLDHSNGDMGGAFAKALRRYIEERLGG